MKVFKKYVSTILSFTAAICFFISGVIKYNGAYLVFAILWFIIGIGNANRIKNTDEK